MRSQPANSEEYGHERYRTWGPQVLASLVADSQIQQLFYEVFSGEYAPDMPEKALWREVLLDAIDKRDMKWLNSEACRWVCEVLGLPWSKIRRVVV